MADAGFAVTVASAPGPELEPFAREQRVAWATLPLARRPSPLRDAAAFWAFVRLLRRLRPAVLEVGTPKAALLGALAARLCGVPAIVYTLHGLRAETSRGLSRLALLTLERLTSTLADETICVSRSLRERARLLGALAPNKGAVLGAGSANGVDPARFPPTARPLRPPTIGFVGRFAPDKGIGDLLEAFRHLKTDFPELRLLLVGDFEADDPLDEQDRRQILTHPDIDRPGFVDDPARFYAQMDVLALPSLREGLPQVVLEAAAAGVPTVAARATGSVDAVIDGRTGLLVAPNSPAELAAALGKLLRNPSQRASMGRAARERTEREFRPEDLWRRKLNLYRKKLVQGRRPRWERAARRTLDLTIAVVALTVSAPLVAAAAIAIKLTMGGPALFRQIRPGFEEQPFELLKLRTMRELTDPLGRPLPDEQRLTPLGRWLRRWSIDELPQLWNVIRGEMSLVGPRPLLSDYLPLYDEQQRKRHWVRPGITGWAQIHGRNLLDWDRRFELDIGYVENFSLALDLKILVRTAWRVAQGQGVVAAGAATPPPFKGSATA